MKAIITGIRGQAGSFLADLLLSKGYKVIGIERLSSSPDYSNIQHLMNRTHFVLEKGDITDFASIANLIKKHQPDEFYNLAAISHIVSASEQPISTCEINYMGVANCLEAIRLIKPTTKFYQASSSECFGNVDCDIQTEETPCNPRNIYGVSKLNAEKLVDIYKNYYGTFACYSRNYNFESYRRPINFITRKITSSVAKMFTAINHDINLHLDNQTKFEYALSEGIIKPIKLGNLDAKRCWGHCSDIVRGMWLMLQQDKPDNYILCSGKARPIRELLDETFGCLNISDWSEFVTVDPNFYRETEPHVLCGDYSKAKNNLGWEPTISFHDMIKEMLEHDIELNLKNNSNVQQSS